MKSFASTAIGQVALLAMISSYSEAFSVPRTATLVRSSMAHPLSTYHAATHSSALFATSEETDEEIERLKSMAAKLRAEAAALESEQQNAIAAAAEKAFNKIDTNSDGVISLEELKIGLEKQFKMELSEKQVKQLMDDFDKNKDGVLQLNEFMGLDVMRNRLDALVRDEKALAQEMAKAAQMEAEAVKLLQAQLEFINDKAPSNTDKLVSTLPYLFPLLDGLQFGKYLVLSNMDNPLSVGLAVIYALYRSIPFGGLVAFFALSFLSGNPSINRLIRFNMQQAIFLDIALFFPGLIAALISLIAPGTIPPAAGELGSDALFFILLATVGYSVVSSLFGQEPNKIPLISQAVENRMPTVEMFDPEGRFLPREEREKKDKDKKND